VEWCTLKIVKGGPPPKAMSDKVKALAGKKKPQAKKA
jgi:hypothetical protein